MHSCVSTVTVVSDFFFCNVVKYLAAVTQDFNSTLETDADCIFFFFFFVVSLITVAVMLFVECCLEKEHFPFGQVLPNMHNNQAWK